MAPGGILLLWDDSMVTISNVIISKFSLSAEVKLIKAAENGEFKITTVYG
jgi:hypothetical protein